MLFSNFPLCWSLSRAALVLSFVEGSRGVFVANRFLRIKAGEVCGLRVFLRAH
jgi:hypothetical protein